MSAALNQQTDSGEGTRFKVFCQYSYLAGFNVPELIQVEPKAGTIESGPDNGRIRVVDAVAKAGPYSRLSPHGSWRWVNEVQGPA